MVIETTQFIPLSTLGIPSEAVEELAFDAPFSWGDNNRTLVFPYRLGEHLQRVSPNLWDDVIEMLIGIELHHPGVYIDLEN